MEPDGVGVTEIQQGDSAVTSEILPMLIIKTCFCFCLFREPLDVAIFFRISDKVEKGAHRFSVISRSLNIFKIIIYGMLSFIAVIIEVERHIRTRHGGNGLQSIRINIRIRSLPHRSAVGNERHKSSNISGNRELVPNICTIFRRNSSCSLTACTVVTCR